MRGTRFACRPGSRAALPCWRHRPTRHDVGLPDDDQVVRALLLVGVEPLAVVAADAFALDDLRPLNRAPLAGLLADAAGLALRPALDLEDRQVRQHAERRPQRTQEPAIRVAHED